MTTLTEPRKLAMWQLIIRTTWHGGNHADRDACYIEICRRGGWLTGHQKEMAGLDNDACYALQQRALKERSNE